jgi:hypothetical protein
MQPSLRDAKLRVESGANVVLDARYFSAENLRELAACKHPQTEHLMGHITVKVNNNLDIKVMLTIAELARGRVTFEF